MSHDRDRVETEENVLPCGWCGAVAVAIKFDEPFPVTEEEARARFKECVVSRSGAWRYCCSSTDLTVCLSSVPLAARPIP
jgi:hypothetical protein